jgi:hypothetical protein
MLRLTFGFDGYVDGYVVTHLSFRSSSLLFLFSSLGSSCFEGQLYYITFLQTDTMLRLQLQEESFMYTNHTHSDDMSENGNGGREERILCIPK